MCQQCAGIWFLQVWLRKLEMTTEIRAAAMNLGVLHNNGQNGTFSSSQSCG